MLDLEVLRVAGEVLPPAHGTIPEGVEWWRAWSFDPWFLIPVGMVAWWYAAGLRRWATRSKAHARWRTALFYAGLALLVLAIESPVDRLAAHQFSMHMVQHELVIMWAIPLMLLGAPTTPLLRGMPRWLRLGVVRPLARRTSIRALYRVLTHPVVAIGVLAALLWAWHLVPGWYEGAVRDQKVHDVQHLSFVFASVLLWWNVIDPRPLHSRVPHLPRVLYIFVAGLPKHLLAAMLAFAPAPLYRYYVEVRPVLPLTALEDQELAGLIMWVPSMMLTLVIMAITFFVWMHHAEHRQRAGEIRGRSGAPTSAPGEL